MSSSHTPQEGGPALIAKLKEASWGRGGRKGEQSGSCAVHAPCALAHRSTTRPSSQQAQVTGVFLHHLKEEEEEFVPALLKNMMGGMHCACAACHTHSSCVAPVARHRPAGSSSHRTCSPDSPPALPLLPQTRRRWSWRPPSWPPRPRPRSCRSPRPPRPERAAVGRAGAAVWMLGAGARPLQAAAQHSSTAADSGWLGRRRGLSHACTTLRQHPSLAPLCKCLALRSCVLQVSREGRGLPSSRGAAAQQRHGQAGGKGT